MAACLDQSTGHVELLFRIVVAKGRRPSRRGEASRGGVHGGLVLGLVVVVVVVVFPAVLLHRLHLVILATVVAGDAGAERGRLEQLRASLGLEEEVLQAEEGVAAGLEDAADLEGPRDFRRRGEEPNHLHGVTDEPAGENGEAEALAGAGLNVGDDLRQRQGGLD